MKKTEISNEKILNRISRIEGQVRGVRRMIEAKKDCTAILNQIYAAREAIAMLGVEVLKNDFLCKQKNREKISDEYIKNIFKAR